MVRNVPGKVQSVCLVAVAAARVEPMSRVSARAATAIAASPTFGENMLARLVRPAASVAGELRARRIVGHPTLNFIPMDIGWRAARRLA